MADADGAVLAIDGIEAGYFPDVPILNGVRATIEAGEMVTIVGPNGAGKSTLVRVVIGLLSPWAGTVHLRGEDVTGRKPHAIVARGVGYVAQRDNVFPTMSVEENLELGAIPLRSADSASRIVAMLDLFPRLAARRSQPAGTLSGGERQMLALARALMAEPQLLLLRAVGRAVTDRGRPDLREDRGDQRNRGRDLDGRAERPPGVGDVPPRLRARRRAEPLRGARA